MQLFKNKEKLFLGYFLYEIVHHCNLNCRSCDHCAPLAKKEFVDIKIFEKDIKQMQKLFDEIGSIAIMGGEPLLHPKISEFLEIARKQLPRPIKIYIYTNGILLNKMKDSFWKDLSRNSITLLITNYRLKIDYNLIVKKAAENNVHWEYEGETGKKEKVIIKAKYDINGTQNENDSCNNCYNGNIYRQLENGKLYKCTICPASRHFNEYFGTNMEIDKKDYINIYKAKKNDIREYLKNPIPFCRYCNVKEREYNQKWGLSKREINEWT